MNYPRIVDGMKISKEGLDSLSQGFRSWEELGVQAGFENGVPPDKIRSGFRKAQKMTDPVSRLVLMCTEPLLQNVARQSEIKTIQGIAMGSLLGCLLADIHYYRTALPEQGRKASPMFYKNTLPSIPVGEVCIAFKIKGPNVFINTGEVSGVTAMIQGSEWIQQGNLTNCLVGGFDMDCPELRSHFFFPLPDNEYSSSAYLFVLAGEPGPVPEFARITKHRSFFVPGYRKPFDCKTLGNMGMESLWESFGNQKPGIEKYLFVSYDGHGVEIEIEKGSNS